MECIYLYTRIYLKESLKILRGQSESVNRRTDNTMGKRKRTNNDPQNITHKTKDRVTRTSLKYIFLVIIFWLKTTKSDTL